MAQQQTLFGPELPEGFRYEPDFIPREEEQALVRTLQSMSFQPFEFQGYIAKRRVIEFGCEYDFTSRKASSAPPIPDFLLPLRERSADFAGVSADEIVECVVHEYPVGAPIGWHRDVPQFETIIGISLLSACRMRLKPYRAAGKIMSIILEPRSAYILSGAARWQYQHSIPEVKELRYSITFRTLRQRKSVKAA
jgi:alkylated DNA repair dioxygenase AlkB